MKITAKIICALFCAVATTGIAAELNPLFQNNAVLQCDARVPVWGVARDGEKITVAFAAQSVSTVATNGVWKIWLQPMKPNAAPIRARHTSAPPTPNGIAAKRMSGFVALLN